MAGTGGINRRKFVTGAALGAGGLLLNPTQTEGAAATDRFKILAALCETIIPSKPGDPGFKDLEPHGITEEVNKSLRPLKDQAFVQFNEASKPFFQGRTFVELDDDSRARFLQKIVQGEVSDRVVRNIYRFSRMTALRVFYSNFPEHRIDRDAAGLPVLKPGDGQLHQITVPNTKNLMTGWDIAGYRGPLTWEQEEKMRAEVQKVHWHDPDDLEALIVRYRPKSK